MNKLCVLFALVLFFQVSAQDKPNPETLEPGAKPLILT
jgi:hypothetical protein